MNLKYNCLMVFNKVILRIVVLLLLSFSNNIFAQLADDITVIANDIGTTSLTKKQVIAYAKGEKNFWNNGKKVIISLPSTKSVIAPQIAQTVFKTTETGVQKYWLSLVFQGRADPPIFFNSDEETINFIEKNKGSIGFIQTKNKSKAANYIVEVNEK